jgi:hypothetical protein
VENRIKNIIPAEVDYLLKYDEFKRYIDDQFEMPDRTVAMLVRFLEQNDGQLSQRGPTREFEVLNSG